MTELEPLLNRIEQLTPHFGRAQEDLVALITRGRNRDYKGVLQNARLVLEMLLRSLITTELKQTPGKATLDELLNKFRQQAHAGLIPTHVLAHMGTVQAWGNLSAHDHAGGLHDSGVKVDLQEAMTSLNSLAAILTWYKERYLQESVAPGTAAPAARQAPAARVPSGRRLALLGGGVALAALASGLGVLAYGDSSLRREVNALYVENGEPPPPVDCQESDSEALQLLLEAGPKLSERVPKDSQAEEARAALALLRARGRKWGPEGSFHVARASLLAERDNPDTAAMNEASLCPGFAAAENLAGRMAVATGHWKDAEQHLVRAAELDARFWKPRFNLGFLLVRLQRVEDAVQWLERAVVLAPEVAEIHLELGDAYAKRAEVAESSGQVHDVNAARNLARSSWCRAKALGHPKATALCAP